VDRDLAVNPRVSDSIGYLSAFPTQGREPTVLNELYDREDLGTRSHPEFPEESAE